MCNLMEVKMEQARQQPLQSMAGWMVALTRTHWRSGPKAQQGCTRVGDLPEEMDSTRAELLGAYAVLHKVRQCEGTLRIWVDNDNVVRGLETHLSLSNENGEETLKRIV